MLRLRTDSERVQRLTLGGLSAREVSLLADHLVFAR